jgi:hypothetical protein
MALGFLEHMRVVSDKRIRGMVTYPLDEILLATLAGVSLINNSRTEFK